jgi:hypothetical protein
VVAAWPTQQVGTRGVERVVLVEVQLVDQRQRNRRAVEPGPRITTQLITTLLAT